MQGHFAHLTNDEPLWSTRPGSRTQAKPGYISLYSMPNITVNSSLFTSYFEALIFLSFTKILTPYKITDTHDGNAKAQHFHVFHIF